MTAKQTLDKLHRYLSFKEEAAWVHLGFCRSTYGKDHDRTKEARAVWSELLNIKRLIEHPERIDEQLNILEETDD